ncbi:MAG: hypothetical protein LBS96_08905 [Oscillospiraceae bacterium]|nr:hypothetical protein [Oscillospiraceae bacterium]
MTEVLSALNQILDGLGFDPKVGQVFIDIIAFLVEKLPAILSGITG